MIKDSRNIFPLARSLKREVSNSRQRGGTCGMCTEY